MAADLTVRDDIPPPSSFDCHHQLILRSAWSSSIHPGLSIPVSAVGLHTERRAQMIEAEGEIWLTLRHRWADGTTHLRFDPLELLERLAVLTPAAAGQPDSLLRRPGAARRVAGRVGSGDVARWRDLALRTVRGG
jgi:hypothetical protein